MRDPRPALALDAIDRALVARLQDGIEVCECPFASIAKVLDVIEDEVVARIERLLADGVLTRFGPMYNADRFGGAFTLAALSVPADDLDRVAALVNAHPEVAHNYERDHDWNLWFVVATEAPDAIGTVIDAIARETGREVLDLPKTTEYRVDLRFAP